jgi:hypothetical protein
MTEAAFQKLRGGILISREIRHIKKFRPLSQFMAGNVGKQSKDSFQTKFQSQIYMAQIE